MSIKIKKTVKVGLRSIIALVLLYAMHFKITGHPHSIHFFSAIGIEPYGRLIVGIIELIAGMLIIFPKTSWLGALISLRIISGSIFFHLTISGIDVNGDGGLLFYCAVLIFVLSFILLWLSRKDIPYVNKKLFR